jgi:hypothetical protein
MEFEDGCLNHTRDPSSNCYVCREGQVDRISDELAIVKAKQDRLLQYMDLIASPLGDEGQLWATEKARECLRGL